jgi:penicillin amidase
VIAGLLLAAIGAAYWFLWRPLPETDGARTAPVRGAITIVRDARGMPHVYAQSEEDALFAEGYAMAQDRLWQMDMSRRLAAGELSEVAGPATTALDVRSRQLRMRRMADAAVRGLPEQDRAQIAAFARGVNFYIESQTGKLPAEFTLMSYDPRPWTVSDTLVILLSMDKTLSDSWPSDLEKWRLRSEGFPDRVDKLYPVRSGGEITPGSNSWAISGKHTSTGRAILANDPHLEYTMPSTWYAVHLRAPNMNVAGVTLPGVPGILIGHNEHIAWGITALQFDTQDLYFETIDVRSGHFAFRGQELQAAKETDYIAVRGAQTQAVERWLTVHGPLFVSEGGRHMSLRWSAGSAGSAFPVIEMDKAGNWGEFRHALSRLTGPGLNFLYADTAGHIGYQAAGRLPLRRTFDGDIPVDGASGSFEWDGFIPFDQMPSSFDPPSGILISANQNPFPLNTPYRVNGRFAAPYRQRQIFDRLRAHEGWSAAAMLSIQTDLYSSMLKYVAGESVRAMRTRPNATSAAKQAAQFLQAWDGRVTKDGPAPLIAVLVYQQLRRRIAEAAAPRGGAKYSDEMAPAVVEMLLRERPRDWFPDWDKMLADAFSDAVDEGRRMQGSRLDQWSYGHVHQITLAHPLAAKLPWVANYLNLGPQPMGGHPTTVQQVTATLGPSMRFVATPGNWDDSLLTLTTGESGQVLSSHYKDQWDAYLAGQGLPLEFSRVGAKSTLMLKPR